MYSLCAAISFVVPDSLSERICSRLLSDCSEKVFLLRLKFAPRLAKSRAGILRFPLLARWYDY